MDEWRQHTAAYTLGALAGDERIAFEAHLLECEECAEEVRSFAPVAVALATSAPPRLVDPDVRARVLASLMKEGRVGPAEAFPASRVVPASIAVEKSSRGARPISTMVPWLAAAASLALAVGLGFYALSLKRIASEARTVVVVLGASDLVRVELAGQPVAPRATARAFWSQSRGLVFTASNLPPLPSGRIYQLWIIKGQTPVGAGLVRPGLDGNVHAVFSTPSDLANAAAMAVTIEPDGGMPAPTGDKYLVGLLN